MGNFVDLTNKTFGRWKVIRRIENRGRHTVYECKCICGKIKKVLSETLKANLTLSCGCLQKELASEKLKGQKYTTKHGLSKKTIYQTYGCMKSRCYYTKDKAYQWYGSKGIKVCDEWKNSFERFTEWALSNGYQEGHTIDRIDSNGDYEPTNCQWLTRSDNSKKRWSDDVKP